MLLHSAIGSAPQIFQTRSCTSIKRARQQMCSAEASGRISSYSQSFCLKHSFPADVRRYRRTCTRVRSTKASVAELQETIIVEVESGSSNSRRLFASVDIAAPWTAVWSALTDYDGLHTFIPGLAQNECLSRHAAGCRLLQVGEQSLALGMKFRARVVLDICEHPCGVPLQLLDDEGVDEGCYPLPRSPIMSSIPRDISFSLHEGDFQAFRGVWRIQDTTPSPSHAPTSRLSYALFVRPQRWMPIALIQSRIQGEVRSNLTAVQQYAQLISKAN